MIDSGYAITLFDRIGRQVVDILWLPSLEALLLGVLVWALLQANRDCTPRVRHFLWVLVLVKPLLTVVAPWQGPFEIPWAPAVLGGGPAPGDHYALGSFIYAGAGLAWIAIAGLGLVRTIPAFVAMTRRSRRAVPVTVPRVRELFDSCLAELGVKKAISLRISDEFAGPVLIALGRPVVLIPSWCILELSNAELRQVLLHELAHYARRDHLTVLLVHFSRIFSFSIPRSGTRAQNRYRSGKSLRRGRSPGFQAAGALRFHAAESGRKQGPYALARGARTCAIGLAGGPAYTGCAGIGGES